MFASVEERAAEVARGIARRFLAQLVLARAWRMVLRARRRGLHGDLHDAGLDDVAGAWAAFVEAVAAARLRLGSDPEEN